jgi:hypothetical protein
MTTDYINIAAEAWNQRITVSSQHRQEVSLFTETSSPALRPTQLPIQRVSEVKWLTNSADHSPQSSAKIMNEWNYTDSNCLLNHR